MVEIMTRLWRAQRQLSNELGREATAEDLADELNMPVSRIGALLRMARQPISLDAPIGDDGDGGRYQRVWLVVTLSPFPLFLFPFVVLPPASSDIIALLVTPRRRIAK